MSAETQRASAAPKPSTQGALLEPFPAERFDRAAAAHLLVRATFGAAPARLQRALDEGLEATLEGLFTRAAEPRPKAEQARIEALGLLPLAQADLIGQTLAPDGTPVGEARLRERWTWMWHGHFATSDLKVQDAVLMLRQIDSFRSLGGGDFRELVLSMLQDPALLIWLDGTLNTAGQPNENLARELMELFCLGRGQYTEHDIQEAARGLSGWRVEGRRASFDARRFDTGDKHLLGVQGALDTAGVAQAVLAHPAVPRHVARRLIRTFVSDEPWPELELELAQALERHRFRIDATLGELLGSVAFYDPAVRANKIASPVEFLARACLNLGIELAPSDAVELATQAGQAPLLPPSVKGWDGGPAWAHPNAWLARRRAARELAKRARFEADADPSNTRALCEQLWPGAGLPSWIDAVEAAARSAPREQRSALCIEALLSAPEAHLI